MSAPSWGDLVDATMIAQADAYDRGHAAGYAEGLSDGRQAAQDAAVWAGAAQVARNVAADPTRTWAPAGQPQRVGGR